MPGNYDEEQRVISLNCDINQELELTMATVIHFAVADWLQCSKFPMAHLPEVVEVVTILVGLGMPRNRTSLVKQSSSYWDTTNWDAFPRPFLDTECHAYANAMAAWIRNEKSPAWINELDVSIKKQVSKSIKFLFKTNDSFFHLNREHIVRPNQPYWLDLASGDSVSSQIIALKSFEPADQIVAEQRDKIVFFLRSNNRHLILHAIDAAERIRWEDSDVAIAEELKLLLEDSDTEIQAKALMALTKSVPLDDICVDSAIKMMDSQKRYVTYVATVALASLDSINDSTIQVVDRAFCRSLQSCDYEFVELFAMAYIKWFKDPKQHLKVMLQSSNEEYLDIAIEAIDNAKEQLVSIG